MSTETRSLREIILTDTQVQYLALSAARIPEAYEDTRGPIIEGRRLARMAEIRVRALGACEGATFAASTMERWDETNQETPHLEAWLGEDGLFHIMPEDVEACGPLFEVAGVLALNGHPVTLGEDGEDVTVAATSAGRVVEQLRTFGYDVTVHPCREEH